MKQGSNYLNPYATPYIPLSKRAHADVNKGVGSAHELNRGNEAAVQFGNQSENTLLPRSYLQNVTQNDGAVPAGDLSRWKDPRAGESQHVNEMLEENSNFDEEMDMAYLQMTFPGLSYGSLYGVYLTNRGDLDAAIDMITQLMIRSADELPDSLDIGDVPESESKSGPIHKEGTSLKGQGASSSSG